MVTIIGANSSKIVFSIESLPTTLKMLFIESVVKEGSELFLDCEFDKAEKYFEIARSLLESKETTIRPEQICGKFHDFLKGNLGEIVRCVTEL